jgi:glc operon protein GlcG
LGVLPHLADQLCDSELKGYAHSYAGLCIFESKAVNAKPGIGVKDLLNNSSRTKQDMNKTRTISVITAEAALEAVNVALTEAAKLGVKISVAIVNPDLNLVAFARADGATPHSIETSRRKANTAASTGKATGWMPADLAVTLPMGTGNLLTNIPGGVPLKFDGQLAGGMGIAGGTVEQDAAVATAALQSLSADAI